MKLVSRYGLETLKQTLCCGFHTSLTRTAIFNRDNIVKRPKQHIKSIIENKDEVPKWGLPSNTKEK